MLDEVLAESKRRLCTLRKLRDGAESKILGQETLASEFVMRTHGPKLAGWCSLGLVYQKPILSVQAERHVSRYRKLYFCLAHGLLLGIKRANTREFSMMQLIQSPQFSSPQSKWAPRPEQRHQSGSETSAILY
jgi:hypothetical protein